MKHLEVLKNLIKNGSMPLLKFEFGGVFSVLDPDLAIRGGGSSRPLDNRGGSLQQKIFGPLGLSLV